MRFLTRDFAEGKLTEFDEQLYHSVYIRHLEEIGTDLPANVAAFALQTLGIGMCGLVLLDVMEDAGDETLVLILSGPKDTPQLLVNITYKGVNTDYLDEAALMQIEQQESELLADEVDLAHNGRFEHRLLFGPEGEIAIQCRDMKLTISRPDDSDSGHSEHQ